jgi:hypothetical protein
MFAGLSVCLSVRTEQLGCHWTNFHKIWCLSNCRKSVEEIQVSLKSYKDSGHFTLHTSHEHVCTLIVLSCWILLRMRDSSETGCRENWNTHFMFSNFLLENHVIYEIMWKNTVKLGRPQMAIWCMRIACWVAKATNTHSEYVTCIAVSLQQSLHERPSMLRYTYIAACPVISSCQGDGGTYWSGWEQLTVYSFVTGWSTEKWWNIQGQTALSIKKQIFM